MDHTYCILHQLSFDINFYETNLGNVIKLAGFIVFPERVSLKFMHGTAWVILDFYNIKILVIVTGI